MKTIKQLKVGDFFRLRPNGKVYVRGEYERSMKRYSYYDFNDVTTNIFAVGIKA